MNRYAIQQTREDLDEQPLFWTGPVRVWHADLPAVGELLSGAAADRELARLSASLPHRAARLSIVDVVTRRERGAVWGSAFRAHIAENGRDSRPAAIAAADAAVALAGFAA